MKEVACSSFLASAFEHKSLTLKRSKAKLRVEGLVSRTSVISFLGGIQDI